MRFRSKTNRYSDIHISIQEHLAERVDELVDEGMSRPQAEQTARREFGNVTLLAERSREEWQWRSLELWLVDLKLVLRRLRRSPAFAITVVLTLAIGIGANAAVFSVLNSVLIRPLPYPEPDRLVWLRLNAPGAAGLADFRDELRLSASMYLTFAAHNKTMQSLGVWQAGTASVTGLAQPEQVNTALVTDGILETLNVPAIAGQWLTAADQDPRGRQRIMLSYGYWKRRFGGDPRVVGRVIDIDGRPREIAGVLPRGLRMVNYDFDLMVPLAFDPVKQGLAGFGYRGMARLRPGVSIQQADADIARLINVWMDSWSNGPGINPYFYRIWHITPVLTPLKDQVVGGIGSVLWLVMAVIGTVMLIASTNVANLLLVRADARRQELAIRTALGASRWSIARELLLESVTLGLLGGVAGLGFAQAGLSLLQRIGPGNLPRLNEITLDGWSLGFTLLLSVFSGLLFGSITVLRYAPSRHGAESPGASRTTSQSVERHRGQNLLVIAQMAMALVLLISAVLMIRTFQAMHHVDPGFTGPRSLQVARISIPDEMVRDPKAVVHLQQSLLDALAAIPGVSSTGLAVSVPMSGAEPAWNEITAQDHPQPPEQEAMRLFNYITPGYFHTAGTALVAGRDFRWEEVYGLRPVGIVSESLAREVWGSAGAAVGKRFREFPSMPWVEVIGVARDVRENGVDQLSPPTVYWPVLMNDMYGPGVNGVRRTGYFVMRTDRAGTQAFVNEMQRAVWRVNSNLPLADVSTMQEIYDDSMARTSFTLVMLAIAGVMALALGVLGVYGVISYAVAQRTREIGIRMALGAEKGRLAWMFVRSALLLAGAGTVAGVVVAAVLVRWMRTLLFGISPLDPATFALVPLALLAAAALASYLPARRTASIDPVIALRSE